MGAYVELPGGNRRWVPADPYCTLEEVLRELRKPAREAPDGSDTYNEVMIAIEHASRYIDRWRGRDYHQHDHTVTPLEFDERSDEVCEDQVFLPYSPLISGLRVVQAGVTLGQDTDYVLYEKDFYDGSRRCIVRRLSSQLTYTTNRWGLDRAGGNFLQVYGLFGYAQASSADVPANLPEVIELAAHNIAAVLSGHLRKEIVSLEGRRETVASKELDQVAKDILGPKWGTVL